MSEFIYEILESENPNGTISQIIKRNDGAFIPLDEANSDYQAYLESLKDAAK